MRRNIAAGVLALLMMLGLAACGQKNQPSGEDAAAMILNAQNEMEKAESMSYAYAMEMAFSGGGESVEMSVDGKAEITMEPTAVKMTMNMNMIGMELRDIQVYMVPEDGQMVSYVGMDLENAGQIQWYKTLAEDATISVDQYNAADSFELFMKNGSEFKAAGKDTIQGASATRYEGVIGPNVLQETLEKSGNMDTITSLLGEDCSDKLAKLSGMPISIWINEAGQPVKYVFDMTDLMADIIGSASEGDEDVDVRVDKCVMSMEVESYNSVGTITVPQEALDSAADLGI